MWGEITSVSPMKPHTDLTHKHTRQFTQPLTAAEMSSRVTTVTTDLHHAVIKVEGFRIMTLSRYPLKLNKRIIHL